MSDFRTPPAHELGPQPDPMIKPGRRAPGWAWLVALAALVVIVGTLYGLNNQEPQTASNPSPPPQTSGPSEAPQPPMSGGRTTGAAPQEQQPAKANGDQSGQQPQKTDQGGQPQGNQSGNAGTKQ